jgi:hypothetical protein
MSVCLSVNGEREDVRSLIYDNLHKTVTNPWKTANVEGKRGGDWCGCGVGMGRGGTPRQTLTHSLCVDD